jgi:hypothetical protein
MTLSPNEHLFAVSIQTPWFVDIANYLVSGNFPQHFSHKEHRCKIIRKSAPYSWIQGYLFKMGHDHVLHCCLREDKIYDVLHACHDEPNGGHFATKITTLKVLNAGYYWPTLHKDAREYVSRCDECQRMDKTHTS